MDATFPPPAENERERVRQAMMRLSNASTIVVDDMLDVFCSAVALYRRDSGCFAMEGDPTRKPAALIVTFLAADMYKNVTGKAVRRTSKVVEDKWGQQETGEFARFLAEIFEILRIKAKAAGQVKVFIRHDKHSSVR
jgi:hypothetical protein